MTVKEAILKMIETDQRIYGLKKEYLTQRAGNGQVAFEVKEYLEDGLILTDDMVVSFSSVAAVPMSPQLAMKLRDKESGLTLLTKPILRPT